MSGLDDLQKIESTDIISVWSTFVSYIRRNYIISIIFPILLLILAAELAYLTKIPHFLIFWVFIIFAGCAFLWQKLLRDFLKHFASDINYSYEDFGDISSVDGTIFDFGRNQNISKIICGKYFGKDTRLFIFSTVVGSGKNKHIERFSILEISFDTMLPNILLNNNKTWFNSMILPIDNEKKLALEGDFQKYFALYVTKEYELEAMQIFTPEIMQMFIDKADKISVEMYKSKVYLYYPNEIIKKSQLILIYSLAKEIILELSEKFFLMKDDVEDMIKYAKLT